MLNDGENMKYQGGVDFFDYKCECSLNNVCVDNYYESNCDNEDFS